MSARLERVDEDLETRRVSGQLEEPHNANDAEEFEDVVVLLKVVEQKVEVEAECRDEVDDVDWSDDERALVRTHHEPVSRDLT